MSLVKAIFFNMESKPMIPIPVMFNPPEYSLKKSNNFVEIKAPGKSLPTLQFINKEIEVLDLNLFFDTSDTGLDVKIFTQPIINLAQATSETGAPPKLLLIWGDLAFSCIMISADQTMKEFSRFGWGIRADIKVSLKGYNTLENALGKVMKYPISNAAPVARNLLSMAKELHGDEKQWRKVAKSKKISNPLK